MSAPQDLSPDASRVVTEEESLLGHVLGRLGAVGPGGLRAGGGIDADLISLRDQISEARAEDLAPLVEEMTRLAALKGKLGGVVAAPVDTNSPYFAHMRLRTGKSSRDVLVGKRAHIDREHNIQIVDWRNAPVSQVYYRYDEGDDYEEELGDRTLTGIVEVRRNVSITKGVLRRIGTPQGTFLKDAKGSWREAVGTLTPVLQGGAGTAARPMAEPPARGALGIHHGPVVRADKGLPEIAALIDREQFDLISQPSSGVVVIQGGAGSGKTTVALHRVAYLSFHDEVRFAPRKMLFVVPSQSLVRYVSGVLPALGVPGVPVVTYSGWARQTRIRCVSGSPTRYNMDTPDAVSRLKKHPGMMVALETWTTEQADRIGHELGRAHAPAGEQWAKTKGALVPRLREMARWQKQHAPSHVELEQLLRRWRRRADDIVADWSELMTDRARLGRALLGPDVNEREIDALVRWVGGQLASRAIERDADGEAILAADGRNLAPDDDEPASKIDEEDDPILLRLVQLKRGALITPDGERIEYEHVAIDEAQDRSSLEAKVLVEAVVAPNGKTESRSITIAGDTAQRLVFDNNFSGWDALLAQVGQPAIVRPLKLSYRSTAEVMQLSHAILGPDLAPKESIVARNGAPVQLHTFGDMGEAMAFLGDALRMLVAREPMASCAVIARHAESADAYYQGLRRSEVPALRRVRRDEFSFQPGVDVTDVQQVKGLEFDYVVMVDVGAAQYPAETWARHLLHIGVTRAAHQLWLVATGAPSPLIPDDLRHAAEGL